jgi:hypothetical protein
MTYSSFVRGLRETFSRDPWTATLFLIGSLLVSGCKKEAASGDDCNPDAVDAMAECGETLTCEPVQGGMGKCYAPVLLSGKVFDLMSSAAIEGARVVALDANGAAASSVAVSGADGAYSLRVPSLRNMDGSVIAADYLLRAEADGYQTFPSGIRPALPIKVMGGAVDSGLQIDNALTSIGLLALPAAPRGIIAGSVQAAVHGGVLIEGGGSTTVSDRDGNFVLFNVMPGAVVVRGYAAGAQLNPASANLAAGMRVDGVVLSEASTPLSTVSGSITLANAPAVTATSVILVLKSTFNTNLERGEIPRGLRIGDVRSSFTIPNVPDGEYTVLASFENDNGVRDPDTSIGGTAIVNITVPAAGGSRSVTLPTAFKVTDALAVRSPGMSDPEAIMTATPTLTWADDSSEDNYQVRVFDSFGNIVWMNLNVPRVTGTPNVSVPYAGPALIPGVYYQFRATSIKGGIPITRTEDLRGVFYLPKQ